MVYKVRVFENHFQVGSSHFDGWCIRISRAQVVPHYFESFLRTLTMYTILSSFLFAGEIMVHLNKTFFIQIKKK